MCISAVCRRLCLRAVSGVEEREGAFFEVKVGQEIDPDNQEINEPYYPIIIRKSD